MAFIRTTAITKLLGMKKRIRGVPGGTSASKTFGILAILISTAAANPMLEISVVSESVPHLKRGAIKDFKKIMTLTKRWHDDHWNKTDSKYTFSNGSYIEFFSADTPGKVHGPRRHILYINEGNRIPFETYHALAIRTSMHIWIDFNPTRKFWYHEHIVGDPDWEEIVLTYIDNEALAPAIVQEIEKAKYKAEESSFWLNWWNIYGLGKLGKLEGQIFKDWKHVPNMPKGKYVYGLDFGYTNDPTALVRVRKHKGELYVKELWHETNYHSSRMIEHLYSIGVGPADPIICDHDLTAIRDLRDHGFRAFKADKRKGSIISGIQALQDIQVNVTYDSHNLIKEEENYFWDEKDGVQLNQPVDAYNHCFVGDTMVNTVTGIKPIRDINKGDEVLTSKGLRPVIKRWNNGIKDTNLYRLRFNDFSTEIQCTPTHLIKTRSGWKPISQLVEGDFLYLPRYSTAMNTGCTPIKDTLVGARERCIGMFGSTIKDHAKRDIISTTSMAIPTITKSAIWQKLGARFIWQSTEGRECMTTLSGLNLSVKKGENRLKHGMAHRKVSSGIGRMPRKIISERKTMGQQIVSSATPRFKRRAATRNFALERAKQSGEGTKQSITNQDSADHVELNLRSIDIQNNHHVVGRALIGVDVISKGPEEVFDLFIDENHEYFANGILVHNCIDSLRYAFDYIKDPRKSHYLKQEKERRGGRRRIVSVN